MAKRHRDAHFIWQGACNPSGMAHALVNACKECLDENVQQRDDAAVRVIVAQIAYICGVWDGVGNMSRGDIISDANTCERIMNEDRAKAYLAKHADSAVPMETVGKVII